MAAFRTADPVKRPVGSHVAFVLTVDGNGGTVLPPVRPLLHSSTQGYPTYGTVVHSDLSRTEPGTSTICVQERLEDISEAD